jgi:hypothetical protein
VLVQAFVRWPCRIVGCLVFCGSLCAMELITSCSIYRVRAFRRENAVINPHIGFPLHVVEFVFYKIQDYIQSMNNIEDLSIKLLRNLMVLPVVYICQIGRTHKAIDPCTPILGKVGWPSLLPVWSFGAHPALPSSSCARPCEVIVCFWRCSRSWQASV